jgi:hypothetical protein
MLPGNLPVIPMILAMLLVLVYCGSLIAAICWFVYVALRLRDISRHLESMSVHQEAPARSLAAYGASIASSLAVIASNAAREAKLAPPAQ